LEKIIAHNVQQRYGQRALACFEAGALGGLLVVFPPFALAHGCAPVRPAFGKPYSYCIMIVTILEK